MYHLPRAACCLLALVWIIKAEVPEIKLHSSSAKNIVNKYYIPPSSLSINIVTLTQKGYIQFLRYITEVPTVTDFTFCIWLNSKNFTHSHPLFSYSHNEKDRRIRAWISPYGKAINLAIFENQVFSHPVNLRKNRWYHICQSWSSIKGAWQLYLNGKLKATGVKTKLLDVQIPGSGDIVIGQEYTDFDKGLDDGVEGDIFGFNLVLSSAITTEAPTNGYNGLERRHFNPHRSDIYYDQNFGTNFYPKEIPSELSYFTAGPNRQPKGFLGFSHDLYDIFVPNPASHIKAIQEFGAHADRNFWRYNQHFINANKRNFNSHSRIINENFGEAQKPLGLLLVEMSYNCALGKGAPLNHEKVVINWAKTAVRVYGGAILKPVQPFCLRF